MAADPPAAGAARPRPARRGRLLDRAPAARALAAAASSSSPAAAMRSTRSSASRSAPTTTSPSRSTCASCWRGSRPCCAARAAPRAPPAAPRGRRRSATASPTGSSTLRRAGCSTRSGQRGRADRAASSTCCAVFVAPSRPRAVARLPARADARPRGGAVRPHDRRPGRPAAQEARGRRRRSADHQVGARRRLHPGAAGDGG